VKMWSSACAPPRLLGQMSRPKTNSDGTKWTQLLFSVFLDSRYHVTGPLHIPRAVARWRLTGGPAKSACSGPSLLGFRGWRQPWIMVAGTKKCVHRQFTSRSSDRYVVNHAPSGLESAWGPSTVDAGLYEGARCAGGKGHILSQLGL